MLFLLGNMFLLFFPTSFAVHSGLEQGGDMQLMLRLAVGKGNQFAQSPFKFCILF